MHDDPVKYIELRPAAFAARLKQKPLAYLPLGTLEWHGEHLPLGADAIQSEALMVACAQRYGGIVLPPLFLGPDRRMELEDGTSLVGMDYAKSTSPQRQLPGSCYWVSYEFFELLLGNILTQLKRAGFTAVFADGHGPSRRTWVEHISHWEQQYGLRLLGVTDELKPNWQYMTDHAAMNETSIMQYVAPALVSMSVFTAGEASPLVGVNGVHPSNASAEKGAELFESTIQLLAPLLQSC